MFLSFRQMKHTSAIVFPLALAALSSCTLSDGLDLSVKKSSSVDPSEITAKVMFVGNSFTYFNDMPSIFASLGTALGMHVEATGITKGAQHLIDTANSNDEVGKQFDEALKTPHTHFILQEHTTTPTSNFNNFLAGVRACKAKIVATQQNPKIYLYSTWAYTSMLNDGETIPQCEARIRAAYEDCGNQTSLPVLYAGKAFTYAYEHQPTINLYGDDNKHPSYAGSYLVAATHLASLFGVDPRSTTFFGDLAEKDAKALLEIAYGVANRLL